jgi:hypothetical protein
MELLFLVLINNVIVNTNKVLWRVKVPLKIKRSCGICIKR